MNNRKRKKYLSAAYRYSFSRLALNYYLYYQTVWEEHRISKEAQEDGKTFGELLKAYLQGEPRLSELDNLRNCVIHKMEIITAYTDCFQIYEYVLNRVERRFEKKPAPKYTPEHLAMRLTEMITSSDASSAYHQMVRSVISQLPVRYTKQKFASLVEERFSAYIGSDKTSIENVLYMLRTTSMVLLPEDMDVNQPDLYGLLTRIQSADFRNLSKEQYEECMDCLYLATEKITLETDSYVLLQDMINDLYVLNLTYQEALTDASEEQTFFKIVEYILSAFDAEDSHGLPEEEDELLEKLEGIQETMEVTLMETEPDGDEIAEKVSRLVSGSSFMKLDTEEPAAAETADRLWIQEKAQQFCQELNEVFGKVPKAVARAIMASILSYLPTAFRNAGELEQYICDSLTSCTDFAEREASMELLEQELIDEDEMV